MNSKFYLLALLVLIVFACNPDGNPKVEAAALTINEKIDQLGDRYLALNRFSGTILASKNGEIVYNNSFGFADFETKKPFTEETAFKLGEGSELIVGNILRDMAAQGKLQLSDEISKYLPEFKSELTIAELLSHKSKFLTNRKIQKQNPNLEYSIITYANVEDKATGWFEKSELDYNVLGLLIEKMSGKSFQGAIDNYSKKLSLSNTYYKKEDPSLATGYLFNNDKGEGLALHKSPVYNEEINFSSQGLKSTAIDLKKIIEDNPETKVQIEGFTKDDGFSYSISNDPKGKTSIIVLSNRRHPVANEISKSVRKILDYQKHKLPLLREPYEIDKKLLNAYAGNYAMNENMELQIINEDDKLFIMMGPSKVPLIPQSKNQFYMEQRDAGIRFIMDIYENVNEAVLLDGFMEGRTIQKKVN